jgi:hypothetical protein
MLPGKKMKLGECFLVETAVSKISLAVWLIDDYTGENPAGVIELSLKDKMGSERKPVRNLGGYYIFFDLPKDSYTVLVKGGKYYFDEAIENVRPSELDIHNPILNISLVPAPAYSFSRNSTLIRGCLLDSQKQGISEAIIGIKGKNEIFQTTENGEFAVYFRGLKENEVKKAEGKTLLIINGENPVLEIKHPVFGNKTESVEVEEGKTVSISITFP